MPSSISLRRAGISLFALAAFPGWAQSPAVAPAEGGDADQAAIIVTGTRTTGLRVADSPAPIQLVGADALKRVGQPNLIQAISQIVPSFTAEAFGGDAANLTLTARLRGLSPNQTLVLVNGKRRHGTANLHVLSGPYQGAASPDLDLIPAAAIERIEILQDGAAAQYGSDAIAGVINIILKSDTAGGLAQVTGGQYYKGDGETFAATGRLAVPLGADGYFDLTLFHRYHGYSQNGGGERRVVQPDGSALTGVPAAWSAIEGYPRLNKIVGDATSKLSTAFFNGGYDLGQAELYSFGSYGRRTASANENYRLPNRISRTVAGVTTFPFPNGFTPRLTITEDDYAATAGIRGDADGWKWDASSTYGKDRVKIYTRDSANASLYADTGFTPRDFYNGSFISSQYSGNLDVSKGIEAGLADPLNIAFGGEYRYEKYTIRQGDAASIYKEGGQSYPGFQPTDAGSNDRKAYSFYLNLTAKPVAAWTVDVAGRYEHYSDFGSKLIGKLTTRFDVSDRFAVRATVANGFRAPTLAESFYSATNVSPTSAVVVLPANSRAATLIGFSALKPEKSFNLSGGVIFRPVPLLTATLDIYQIQIKDRIAATGTILGQSGTTVINPAVLAAIRDHGNILDPTVSFVGVSVFTNGIDTRTRGAEFALSYPSDLGFARAEWSLTANYNKTVITRNRLGEVLFNQIAQSNIETAPPRYKIGLGTLLTAGPLSLNLRETVYGKSSQLTSPSGAAPFYNQKIGTAAITDIELSYKPVRTLELSVGANNLFDKRPPTVGFVPGSTTTATAGPTLVTGGQVYDAPYTFSPYGINGGYYYARVTLTF